MVSTAGAIVIAVVVVLVAAAVGWIVFTQLRARRLGLPPPTLSSYLPWKTSENGYGPPRPAPGGVLGWFNDQVRKFKNRNNRSAAGAYEQPLQGGAAGAGRRDFGPLDPDEAWDSRVGNEADGYGYYEEREMGRPGAGAPSGGAARGDTEYAGASYGMNLAGPYGRAGAGHDDDDEHERGRRPGTTPGSGAGRNPFDDDMASSLRGVSPRPMETGHGEGGRGSLEGRRSAFREDV